VLDKSKTLPNPSRKGRGFHAALSVFNLLAPSNEDYR
jgi:hypothetical protein